MAVLTTEKTALIISNHGDEVYGFEKLVGTAHFRTLYGNAASPSRLRAYLLHDRVDWLIIGAQHCHRNGKVLVFPNGQELSMPDLLFNVPRFPEFVGLLACNTWKIGDCFRRNGTKLALVTGTDLAPAGSYWPFTYLYIESLLQGIPAGAAFVQAQGRFQSLYPRDHTPWQFGLIGDYSFQMGQNFVYPESQNILQPNVDDRVLDSIQEAHLNAKHDAQVALVSSLGAAILCPSTDLTNPCDDSFKGFAPIAESYSNQKEDPYQSLFGVIQHLANTLHQISSTESVVSSMTEKYQLEESVAVLWKTINYLSGLSKDNPHPSKVALLIRLAWRYKHNELVEPIFPFVTGHLPGDVDNRIYQTKDKVGKPVALSSVRYDFAPEFVLITIKKKNERFSARQIIEIIKRVAARVLLFCSTRFW